jgi:lipopolysaccharide/colanic/teichoic acid biosynthesis glycosyltransferase
MTNRIVDVIVSAFFLILLSPFIVVIAVAIKLTSRGPVFFRQTRVGLGGKDFSILKFRTMTTLPGAEEGLFRPGNTVRITKVGSFLRATKIDELPQFWNVLKGDMTLVGPRPEVRSWVNTYPERWAFVHTVKPGITDPASVMYRNEEKILAASRDPEETYRREILPKKLDLYEDYVRSKNLLMDIKVMGMTFLALFHFNR